MKPTGSTNTRPYRRALVAVFATALIGLPLLVLAQKKDDTLPTARRVAVGQQESQVMAGTGVPGDVSKRINQFFAAFRKKQIKSAYEFLLGDSELSKNKKTIETLNEGASKLLVTYGVFDGHEIIRWEYAGSRLLRIEAAAYAKSQPFRWTLYFYKSKNTWKVIDLQLSADPLAMFEKK